VIRCFALILPVRVSAKTLLLLAAAAAASGLILFVRGFLLLVRNRLLARTRTSKIRGASPGLVELSGFVVGPHTMPAPITGRPCYLYRTTAWEPRDSGGKQEWVKVAEETMHLPFFLDDHTGQVLVNPLGVELDLHREFREEYSVSSFPASSSATADGVPAAVADFLRRQGVTPADRIRVEECCIRPKDFLYAMGTLAEKSGVDARPALHPVQEKGERAPAGSLLDRLATAAPSEPAPQVIQLSEPAAAVPAPASQQSKIAAALLKAGMHNPNAWLQADVLEPSAAAQIAPQVAEIAVNLRLPANATEDSGTAAQEDPSDAADTDKTARPVVLLKGLKNPVFLISWRSQSQIARALAGKAFATVCGGCGLVLFGLCVLLAQSKLL